MTTYGCRPTTYGCRRTYAQFCKHSYIKMNKKTNEVKILSQIISQSVDHFVSTVTRLTSLSNKSYNYKSQTLEKIPKND